MRIVCAFDQKHFTLLLAYFLFPNVDVIHHKMIMDQSYFFVKII